MTTAFGQAHSILTLENAVRAEIEELHGLGQEFSVFNITQLIREKVNSSILTISGLPIRTGAYMKQEIFHTAVRAAFDTVYSEFYGRFTEDTSTGYRKFLPVPDSPLKVDDQSNLSNGPLVDPIPQPIGYGTTKGLPAGDLSGLATKTAPAVGYAPIAAPPTTAAPDSQLDKLVAYIDNDVSNPISVLFEGENISLGRGRAAWSRKCDASSALNAYVQQALSIPRAEAAMLCKQWQKTGVIEFRDNS